MPPHIADREVAYPVTFINFDEIMNILADYEIAMAISSPSSTYTIRGQQVPGISVIFRAQADGAGRLVRNSAVQLS